MDHPLYQKPQLRTKMRSILPRLLGLCCILVVVMMGCGYLMYSQLAAGYVQIKPGTAHFSTVAKMAAHQREAEDRDDGGEASKPAPVAHKSKKMSLKKIFKSDLGRFPMRGMLDPSREAEWSHAADGSWFRVVGLSPHITYY